MYKYTHSLFWCFALLLLPVFCISMNKTSGTRTSGGPVLVIYLDNRCENDEYIMHCLSNLLPCCPNLISPSLSLSLSHMRFLLLLAVSFWEKPVNGMQLLAAVIFAEQVAFLMWVPVMKYSWRGCSSVLFVISYVRQSFRHHLPCLAFPYLVFSIPVGGGLLLLNAKGTLQGNEQFGEYKNISWVTKLGLWWRTDQPYALSNYYWYTWDILKQKHAYNNGSYRKEGQAQMHNGLFTLSVSFSWCYSHCDV